MKKIFIFIFTFVIICLMVVLPSFALTNAPTQEGQDVYRFNVSPNNLYYPYYIKYTEITDPRDGTTNLPKNADIQGFFFNMFGITFDWKLREGGQWIYKLQGNVYIRINSDASTGIVIVSLHNDNSMDVSFGIFDFNFNDYEKCPDFAYFVAENQVLYFGTFTTARTFDSIKQVTTPLWGNIVDAGSSENEDFYEAGYGVGYMEGYGNGYNDATSDTQEGNENAYNLGYLAGQDSNGIVAGAVDGFFNAITDFFYPFLSIGVGNLTLFTILGLIVIAGGVMIIIKIIRG